MQVFKSLTASLYFVVQRDVCPGASTSAKGSGSQVPDHSLSHCQLSNKSLLWLVHHYSLHQIFPAPSPSRTRENLYSWLPVGGALLLVWVNKLWAEGTSVACEPAHWVGDTQSSLSFCKSDQATFLTANAQSSQCEDPGSRAQLSQGGHEHKQEVNLGCHKSLRTGLGNKPTSGLNDHT